jgi:hypothetical protein
MQPLEALRKTVPMETNLTRKGFVSLGKDLERAVSGTDLLGYMRVSRPLRLIDLEILSWLSATRDRSDDSVTFSRTSLGTALFGRTPGGRERELVNESLGRLLGVSLTFDGYSAWAREKTRFESVGLLNAVEQVNGHTLRAGFAPWYRRNLEHGYATYIDWQILRQLRGLAKRLWIYLEAENYRNRSDYSPDRAWLALGPKTWRSMGMSYAVESQARSAIAIAASRIANIDPGYRFEMAQRGRGHLLRIQSGRRREASEFNIDVAYPILPGGRERGNPDDVTEVFGDWDRATAPSPLSEGNNVFAHRDNAGKWTMHVRDCPSMLVVLEEPLGMPPEGHAVLGAARLLDLAAWFEAHRLPRPLECQNCFRTGPLEASGDPPMLGQGDDEESDIPF